VAHLFRAPHTSGLEVLIQTLLTWPDFDKSRNLSFPKNFHHRAVILRQQTTGRSMEAFIRAGEAIVL
jgi:hypothetical protein